MRLGILSYLILITIHIGGCATGPAPELVEADCGPAREGAYVDPLARPELSIVSCLHPSAAHYVFMATDANISWPIIQSGRLIISFEEQILDGPPGLGDGLFYFDNEDDRVFWVGRSENRAVISLTGADPIALTKQRRWLAIDLAGSMIVGIADQLADAVRLF